MKTVLIVGLCIGGLLVVFILFSAIAGNYFYNLALNSRKKKPVFSLGEADGMEGNEQPISTQEEKAWFCENCHAVSLRSRDGIGLRAYQLDGPPDSNQWAIIVHGYTNCAADFSCAAIHFREKGFHVLAPDLRGHGASGGDTIGMGWLDRLDLIQWISWLLERHADAQIVLYGVSMGAAAVLMATGEALPANVKCAVEDCGYTSAEEQFSWVLKKEFHLPKVPIYYAASLITRLRGRYWFSEASALNQVSKSRTPTLFIHGTNDAFVPFSMCGRLYEAAACEKQTLAVEGAIHALSHRVAPTLYWETLFQFVQKHLD